MKKITFPIIFLILFIGYFSAIPQKNIIIAAITTVTNKGACNYSYTVKPDAKDWQGNEMIATQCDKNYPICRTEQLNMQSSEFTGMDCLYENTCYCFAEDFKSIKEGGSEQIVDYVEPLVKTDDLKPSVTFADLTSKTNQIVTIATGIAGGIAFLLIVIGAFQIVLSAGNPDRIKAGKEMITAALAGLFLIIFSVFILKLIGADILQIPGFE